MIVKSHRKIEVNTNINIKLTNKDGTNYPLERKDHIKYLGVLIDDTISWKYHISFVCSRIARNIGIISKLRYYLTLKQLKQLYYNLIYPYISYAILAWGSTYKSHIQKVQIKQNQVIRLIFFAISYGENTESALPLLNLLDILTINNVFRLQALKFTHQWHRKQLPNIFKNYFHYARDVHSYNTRYASKNNLYKPRVRTNIGKHAIPFMAIDYWQQLPDSLKKLNTFSFSIKIKHYLLTEQYK